MVNPGTNILILFFVAAALAFGFPLLKDGVFKRLCWKQCLLRVRPIILVVLPFVAMFGLAGLLGCPVTLTLPCFLAAIVLYLVCSSIGLTPLLSGVLLLCGAVLFTLKLPADGAMLPLAATIMGLLAGKVTNTIMFSGERSLEDVMAPLSWLAGVIWLNAISPDVVPASKQGLLLGVISVCLLLRIFQRPFMSDDRWLLKRLILAATGGLAVLIVITKLLVEVELAPLAMLVGGGLFATYLFQNVDLSKDDYGSVRASCINLLVVMAALTLVATRIFGMYGLILLIPTVLIAPRFSIAQFIGSFFAVRVLVQVFIAVYESNVTGINIMHAYTGAAEYAGLLLVAILAVCLRDVQSKPGLLGLTLGSAVLVPVAANYYLHAEPASSLLVAASVSAAIFAALFPILLKDRGETRQEIVLLVPALMSVIAITYSGLLEAGNNATNEFKATILAYALGAAVVCCVVGYLVFKHSAKGTAAAPAEK